MKKARLITRLLFVALSIVTGPLVANGGMVTNPPDFGKLTFEQAGWAAYSEEVKPICPEYITNLVTQFRQGGLSHDNKTVVIYLMGRFHPTNDCGIEFLVENIDFRASRIDPATSLPRWGDYPAYEALCNIGMPVVKAVLSRLADENKELREHLMCDVLVSVEGHAADGYFSQINGKKIVRSQVMSLLNHERDPAKRGNLNAALVEIEKQKTPLPSQNPSH